MTIDNLSNLGKCVEGGKSTLLVARQSGKDWNYTLETLASNLINDPIVNRTTLGTTAHPFESATIKTLNVTNSATVAGSVTVNSTSANASALTVKDGLTVKGSMEVTDTLRTQTAEVDGLTKCTNLYGADIGEELNTENQISQIPGVVKVATSLSTETLSASTVTSTKLYGGTISGVISSDGTPGGIPKVNVTNTLTVTDTCISTNVNATTLNAVTVTSASGTVKTDYLYGKDKGTNIDTINVSGTLSTNNLTLTAPEATLTVSKSTAVTASNLNDLTTVNLTNSLTAKSLTLTTGGLEVKNTGTITVGTSGTTSTMKVEEDGTTTISGTLKVTNKTSTTRTNGNGALQVTGGIWCGNNIFATGSVYSAVWNDLADCIPVNEEAVIEPGYCYCFNGEKYYKSTKYLEKGIIGIESDTYGMHMGSKPGIKQMNVAVSGFALAYVDKEYESGTPLTCMEGGYLTEIAKQDKIEYPERIVGTYWKPEPNEEWGSSDRKVKVNSRHWIKIK